MSFQKNGFTKVEQTFSFMLLVSKQIPFTAWESSLKTFRQLPKMPAHDVDKPNGLARSPYWPVHFRNVSKRNVSSSQYGKDLISIRHSWTSGARWAPEYMCKNVMLVGRDRWFTACHWQRNFSQFHEGVAESFLNFHLTKCQVAWCEVTKAFYLCNFFQNDKFIVT